MFYYSIMVQRILLVVIYLYYTIVFSTFQMSSNGWSSGWRVLHLLDTLVTNKVSGQRSIAGFRLPQILVRSVFHESGLSVKAYCSYDCLAHCVGIRVGPRSAILEVALPAFGHLQWYTDADFL